MNVRRAVNFANGVGGIKSMNVPTTARTVMVLCVFMTPLRLSAIYAVSVKCVSFVCTPVMIASVGPVIAVENICHCGTVI